LLGTGEAFLDPGGLIAGVVQHDVAGDVDPLGAPLVELGPEGLIAEPGVHGGHLRGFVAVEALHDVLGDTVVDHPCAEGVTKLMRGDPHRLAVLVDHTTGGYPGVKAVGHGGVREVPCPRRVANEAGEQLVLPRSRGHLIVSRCRGSQEGVPVGETVEVPAGVPP
jgi:hypothetical protein